MATRALKRIKRVEEEVEAESIPRKEKKEKAVVMQEEKEEKKVCGICREEIMEKRDPVYPDCCGRPFCNQCLHEWFKIVTTCPLCRGEVHKLRNGKTGKMERIKKVNNTEQLIPELNPSSEEESDDDSSTDLDLDAALEEVPQEFRSLVAEMIEVIGQKRMRETYVRDGFVVSDDEEVEFLTDDSDADSDESFNAESRSEEDDDEESEEETEDSTGGDSSMEVESLESSSEESFTDS